MKKLSGGLSLLHLKPVCPLSFISIKHPDKYYVLLPIFMYKKNQNFEILLSYAIIFRSEAILIMDRDVQNVS